jgi:hypothetical protein
VFLVNHGNRAVTVGLAGEDLLTGAGGRSLEVGPGAIAVVAEVIDRPSAQGSAGNERREQ